MERKQQSLKFPLTASKQQKLRVFYKNENELRKNASEEQVFNSLGIQNRNTAYRVMMEMYNIKIEEKNDIIEANRKVERKEKRIAKKKSVLENKEFTFIIHYVLQTTYKEDCYDTGVKKSFSRGDTVITNETSSPETAPKKMIPEIIDLMNFEDNYKIIVVLSSKVEFQNTEKLNKDRKIKTKQPNA